MVIGNTLISMLEPKYKKYKDIPLHGNWAPGAWYRGERLPGMWETKTRSQEARVNKYRRSLIASGVSFTECVHAPGKIPGFDVDSGVVEFIFFRRV